LALAGGVKLVAVTSVPFGLVVGALAPHELEGVLILTGVVGIQLTLQSTQTTAKLLPFWEPPRLIQHAIDASVAIGAAVLRMSSTGSAARRCRLHHATTGVDRFLGNHASTLREHPGGSTLVRFRDTGASAKSRRPHRETTTLPRRTRFDAEGRRSTREFHSACSSGRRG
jgi:hypothetical protein